MGYSIIMHRIVFFCGLIISFYPHPAWVSFDDELPYISPYVSPKTPHAVSSDGNTSPSDYTPQSGSPLTPDAFKPIVEQICPNLFRFPNGATDHAAQGHITNVAQDWMGKLSQNTIESLFLLGAQYVHELKHQDHFNVTDLERFLRELGTLETLYPETTKTACGILFDVLHKGRIESWRCQKECLHRAAKLFHETQNEHQTGCIIDYLYQFTSPRTSLEKFDATLELLKELTTLFPFDYQSVFKDITDNSRSIYTSSDYVVLLEGFIQGHRAALTYPSQSPITCSRASTPSVHSHSSDPIPPSGHPFYRPGSVMTYGSPPSGKQDTHGYDRPYPVSPSLPPDMDYYPYPESSIQSEPAPNMSFDDGFYPSSPSLPIGFGSPYHP
ncbi:MAG: hypothetical protein ACK5PQ_00505 [Alphaproteobacteria bacterium]